MADKKNKSLLFRLFADSHPGSVEEETPQAGTQPEPQNGTGTPEQELQQQAQETIAELLNQADTPEQYEPPAEGLADSTPAAGPAEPVELDENGNPIPIDAKIEVTIEHGNMEAFVEVWRPQYGGAEVNPRAIRMAIAEAGVVYGIQDRAIFDMTVNKPYDKGRILIAAGTPKEDGADGFLTERFPREQDLTPFKNNDGTVDFKKLNIVREIQAGTVITVMTPPTPGVDGTNVKGEPLKAAPGKPKQLARGNNMAISPDGLTLTASATGNLSFQIDRFNVETTFVVNGSVDNNTGNIKFCGDVLIKGDVREGYEIHSKGGVRIKGTVEGGSLYAEKDILIDGGFNGMKRGEVVTNTSITSKFLQNCTVHAKENIVTEAIINSVVECDGSITVTKGKGTIVGGKVTALHSVDANIIGSDVNTPTAITVGLSPTIVEEKQKLEQELKDVENSKEALHKNLIYLERCAKMGPLSPKNLALVDSCNKQKVLNLMREGKCTRRLAEVNALIEDAAADSSVKSKVTYPSTKITIQNISVMTKSVYNRSIFRKQEGEIKITPY